MSIASIKPAKCSVSPNNVPVLDRDEIPSPWVSSSGTVAHPDSPQGAGGNGRFRIPGLVDGHAKQSITVPQPSTHLGRNHVLSSDEETALKDGDKKPPKINPPPITVPKSFTRTEKKNAQNMEVELTFKILADLTEQDDIVDGDAETGVDKFTMTAGFNWANYATSDESEDAIVTEVSGTNKLEGLIELRIRYAKDIKPEHKVGYGRGTLPEDIVDGNISIGFHEHCHLDDWWNYLKTKELPLDFKGKTNMKYTEYEKKQIELEAEFQKFIHAGSKLTFDQTDEVGDPPQSKFKKKP